MRSTFATADLHSAGTGIPWRILEHFVEILGFSGHPGPAFCSPLLACVANHQNGDSEYKPLMSGSTDNP
jgi:hypothetical protein